MDRQHLQCKMKEKTFDILMISWGIFGAIVIGFLSIQFGWITPTEGLFGSQNKVILDACLAGSEMCPW